MPRIVLINPNTSEATTAAMTAIARAHAPQGVEIVGMTVASGPPLITNEEALSASAIAVLALGKTLEGTCDAVIVSAFGDPGLEALREVLSVPVTGIAEAAFIEAGQGGRHFAVATTTPLLERSIMARAAGYGFGAQCLGVFLTPGDPAVLMADPARLLDALREAGEKAIAAGAKAVVIGGGPLAEAARAIAHSLSAPLVEPIPAAVRLSCARLFRSE